jgi:hypothetical protein
MYDDKYTILSIVTYQESVGKKVEWTSSYHKTTAYAQTIFSACKSLVTNRDQSDLKLSYSVG